MKFIDIAEIYVKAGDGGNGHISFRREKFVPKGGPSGGDGGNGGNVIIKVDRNLSTLLDFKYVNKYLAEDGKRGGKSLKTGKSGKDKIIRVPQGTVIINADTEEVIADLTEIDSEYIVAKGGNGGFGNARFATSTNQAPRFANPGLPGEELNIILELKLLADVGIVGFPNVGKSTLISVISAAKPKIADYHFTTLIPNLGITKIAEGKSYTVADIPGLIEGASEGKGLGIQFLRHIERTRVLLFLIDINSVNPENDYQTLMNELITYNPELKYKNKVICFSKSDTVSDEIITKYENFKIDGIDTFNISAVTHLNIVQLKFLLWDLIEKDKNRI